MRSFLEKMRAAPSRASGSLGIPTRGEPAASPSYSALERKVASESPATLKGLRGRFVQSQPGLVERRAV